MNDTNRQYIEAIEVETELEYCYSRIVYHDVEYIKKRIGKREAEVMSDPSLKKDTIDLSEGKILLHTEQWECMLNEAERATNSIPRAERRLLSHIEAPRYRGAICALRWLLGHHDEDLAVYLTSDRFKASIELKVQSRALGNDVDEKSEECSDMNAKTGPVVCRTRDEVEHERNLLLLLDQLQHYHFLNPRLDKGLVEISSDPCLEEEPVCQLEHVTRVHAEYWEWLKLVAELAEGELPKELRDEPLDNIKADRVAGAKHALEWFLSGENNRLATFLAFTVEGKTE